MSTDQRLVAAAKALLDSGGEEAVTLRAVAHASDVSHNAPYKHFESRDDLLLAIAATDFAMLREEFQTIRSRSSKPAKKLADVLHFMITFSREHRARYMLLFNNPAVAAAAGPLKEAAGGTFFEWLSIVRECQTNGDLPDAPGETVASLLFATMHGLIAMESVGGLHPEKGLRSIESSMKTLISLMS